MNRLVLKSVVTLTFVLALSSDAGVAQEVEYPDEATISSYLDDYYEHPSVILYWDKINIYKGGVRRHDVDEIFFQRYVVIDDESSDWTNINLEFDETEELDELRVVVRDRKGTTTAFDVDDMWPTTQGGIIRYRLPIAHVEAGDIVDIRYELRRGFDGSSGRPFKEVLRFSVPALNVSYKLSLPKVWLYRLKQNPALDHVTEHRSIDPNSKGIFYEATNVEAFVDEPYSPELEEVADVLEVQLLSSDYGRGFAADLTWERLAADYKSFALDKDRLFRSPISPKAKELCMGLQSDSSKVAKILDYTGMNIQFDNYSPNETFASVLKNGSGNIYLVNGLVSALLAECSIDNQYALVRPATGVPFDSLFVSYYDFVVPALRIDLHGEPLFAFSYLTDLPLGHIPEYFRGAKVMLIDEDGLVGFDTVPEVSPFDAPSRYEMKIDLAQDGSVHVDELSSVSGSMAYWQRLNYQSMDSLQRENYIRSSIEYDYIFDIYDVKMNNVEAIGTPVETVLKYTMPGQTIVTPEEVVFRTSGIFQPYTRSVFKVDPDKRTNPIKIGAESDIVKEILITYPNTWTLQHVPVDVRLENQFGTASITYETGENNLMVKQEISWNRGLFPKDEYQQLLDLIGENSRIYLKSLVFNRGD